MTHGTYLGSLCLQRVAFAFAPRHTRIRLGSVSFDHVTLLRLSKTYPRWPKLVLDNEDQLLRSSRAVLNMLMRLDVR
jgi:hypothetical protein